jgi:hypothetical protein
MRLRIWIAVLGLLSVLAGCTGGQDEPGAAAAPGPSLPAVWRWESYHDVEVAVPGDWGYGGFGRWSTWCADGVTKDPTIGRPAGVFGVLCRDPRKPGPDPGSLIANTGPFAAFVPVGDYDIGGEGDRRVVHAGETDVVIQAPAELRNQIAATVHQISGENRDGCPLAHRLSLDPTYRPAPWDPASVDGTTSVSVCRYELAGGGVELHHATLFSSLKLAEPAAGNAIAAILAAPVGGGPNRTDPRKCDLDRGYGFEAYVVRIAREGQDPAEIVVHYSGCTHNGFDDGRRVRTLTAEGLAPLIAEPNRPNGFIGDLGMPGLMARAQKLGADA